MTATSFSRRSWSETAAGTAASGEAGLWLIDAVAVVEDVERGVDAPVAVAVEWDDDESYSLPEVRIMDIFVFETERMVRGGGGGFCF